MGKKKKSQSTPRRKRMSREARLQSAGDTRWVEIYRGKNIVKGYGKWFNVDPLCAVIELRKLGVKIDFEIENRIRASIEAQAAAKKRRKEKSDEERLHELYPDMDETFAYIVGYTSGGFPYGVTCEELDEEPPWRKQEDLDR